MMTAGPRHMDNEMKSAQPPETRKNQRRHVVLLSSLAVGMFGFAFAMVPLYQIYCELTGINGKTAGSPAETAPHTPADRCPALAAVPRG